MTNRPPQPYAATFHLMDPELRAIITSQKRPDRLIRPTVQNVHKLRPLFDASSERWQSSPVIANALDKCRAERPWRDSVMEIECRDGYRMKAEVYTPCSLPEISAKVGVMVLVHGGGLCMGSLVTDRFIGQLLCSRLGVVVVSIEYRLLPDVSHEKCSADVYDALSWVQVNAGVRGSALERVCLDEGFLVCGPSGGGNLILPALYMAAVELQKAEDVGREPERHVPRVSGVMMLMTGFPVEGKDDTRGVSLSIYRDLTPSWKDLEEAPIMNRQVNPDYGEFAKGQDILTPSYSALNIPPSSPLLNHICRRWYHQTAGLDMWQDSAVLWLGILLHGEPRPVPKANLVYMPSMRGRPEVRLDHYEGLPHTWWSVYPQHSRTRGWIEDLVAGAEWALGRGPGAQQHSSRL